MLDWLGPGGRSLPVAKRRLKRKHWPPRYRLAYLSKLKAWKVPLVTITLPADLTAETRTLSGWGRTNPVTAQVVQPQLDGAAAAVDLWPHHAP
jgi:hypothetical protein